MMTEQENQRALKFVQKATNYDDPNKSLRYIQVEDLMMYGSNRLCLHEAPAANGTEDGCYEIAKRKNGERMLIPFIGRTDKFPNFSKILKKQKNMLMDKEHIIAPDFAIDAALQTIGQQGILINHKFVKHVIKSQRPETSWFIRFTDKDGKADTLGPVYFECGDYSAIVMPIKLTE